MMSVCNYRCCTEQANRVTFCLCLKQLLIFLVGKSTRWLHKHYNKKMIKTHRMTRGRHKIRDIKHHKMMVKRHKPTGERPKMITKIWNKRHRITAKTNKMATNKHKSATKETALKAVPFLSHFVSLSVHFINI